MVTQENHIEGYSPGTKPFARGPNFASRAFSRPAASSARCGSLAGFTSGPVAARAARGKVPEDMEIRRSVRSCVGPEFCTMVKDLLHAYKRSQPLAMVDTLRGTHCLGEALKGLEKALQKCMVKC